MAELRDLYDINSNKTDKTYHKGDIIPEGYYPMVVMVVIRNSEGKFLMQKRVESKGGDWGVTGGHPKAGETPIEGIITEVKEELGLVFSKDDFIEYDSGCDGKDCYKMYYVNKDIDINKITLDSRLEEDLGLSSVALIYFAVMIEEQFDISLEDEKLSNFKTINDVINCIIKKA